MEEQVAPVLLYGTADLRIVYAFLLVSVGIAAYMVRKHIHQYRLEVFVLAFYLLTGNANELLTFSVPGVSAFQIQPDRFLFLFFSFFLVRKLLFSRENSLLKAGLTTPWFMAMLYLYVLMIFISQLSYVGDYGLAYVIVELTYPLNILVLIFSLKMIVSKEVIGVLGKMMILGAIFTSLVSIVQFGLDPMFMRVGDQRLAFGGTLRANGFFFNEYCNAYYILTALTWALVTVKKEVHRHLLIGLFSIAIFCTFQRMSWVILALILSLYFFSIAKISLDRILIAGLVAGCLFIGLFMTFQRKIMNSGLVKERLAEMPTGRLGYYSMVLDNIWKKPFLGYGGKNNELYYYSMLRITSSRARATGAEGDIHSGYFTSLFYYGLPALLFFSGFVFLALFYFGRLSSVHPIFAIPFLLGLLYALGNLTNTLLFFQYVSVLYAIHLGIGLGARQKLAGLHKRPAAAEFSPPMKLSTL